MPVITQSMIEAEVMRRAMERAELQYRLDHGEEIAMEDAIDLFGVRKSDELWRLSHLAARGQVGGPCEAYSEIPQHAWYYLRWAFDYGGWLAVTPEGKRIYGLLFRSSQSEPLCDSSAGDGDQLPDAMPIDGRHDDSSALPSPIEVLREIVAMPAPVGEERQVRAYYGDKLRAAGLSLSNMGRVGGLSVRDDGSIRNLPGSVGTELARLLVLVKFEMDYHLYPRSAPRSDVARAIMTWLCEQHPHAPNVQKFAGPLRNIDGKILNKFVKPLLPTYPSKPLLGD